MNNKSFYHGILVELRKVAADNYVAQPRKRSMFSNPMFWGGLGLAGLGGYGLYKGLQHPTVPSPTTTPAIPGLQQTPDVDPSNKFDTASQAVNVAGGRGLLAIGGANAASGGLNALSRIAGPAKPLVAGAGKAVGNLAGRAAGSLAGRAALGSVGIGNMIDSINPNVSYSNNSYANNGIKATQGVGGALDAFTSLASKKTLGSILAKAAPAALGSAGAATLGTEGAGILIPGVNIAVGVGSAGQLALGAGGIAAENHSNRLGALTDFIPNLSRSLHSPDPSTSDEAMNSANQLFNSYKGQDIIKRVTNPGFWGRIGYDPLHAGYSAPESGGLTSNLNRVRELYHNKLLASYATGI